MAYNVQGFAMCGLCAKYFQPHIAKPVLSTVLFLSGGKYYYKKVKIYLLLFGCL